MRQFFSFLLVLLYALPALSQAPKREFRAAWVATIGNIDWPSQKGLDAEVQKNEFIAILNTLSQQNMNAVVVQIRPAADAFYHSEFEPWSRYLSGTQGKAPSPLYDPLQFMITESHKRGIEFHAWFNPYRALIDAAKNPNPFTHCTYTHPEWFVNYGGKKYFDPGLPEVRNYFMKIVMDVVNRYDIDAVHFDDYFYPYRIAKVEFPDQKSFARYGQSFTNKEDWRRQNVNQLIESLSKQIKKAKPYVKFGISPFGVWRNANKDTAGSNTRAGQTNYDDLYADVLLWLRKGWIDYILPQLYWEIGHRAADYETLLTWWADHSYDRHVYIGHGIYQLGNSKNSWRSVDELNQQLLLLRKKETVQGSCLYSMNALAKNKLGVHSLLSKKFYAYPALLPSMPWLADDEPPKPPKLKVSYGRDGYRLLQWNVENSAKEDLQFVIYRFKPNERIDITKPNAILDIVRTMNYLDKITDNSNYVYIVTALDRLHNESSMSNIGE